MKMLSIGMIVKNEEERLQITLEALESLRRAVDTELIIADTGSSDRTPEIAKVYADQFIQIPWENDFAKARNATLARATGKWFFYLDADEVLTNPDELIHFFQGKKSRQYPTAQIRIYNLMSRKNQQSNDFWSCRLFQRRKEQRFTGAIHESITVQVPIYSLQDTYLWHEGYNSDDKERMQKKSRRNMEILEERLAQTTELGMQAKILLDMTDALGVAANRGAEVEQRAREAITLIDRFTEKEMVKYKYSRSRAYSLLLRQLYNNHDFSQCLIDGQLYLDGQEKSGPQDIDVYFVMGYSCIQLKRYQQAIDYYEKYFALLRQDRTEVTIFFVLAYPCYEDLAQLHIAQCYAALGNTEEAWKQLQPMTQHYVHHFDLLQYKYQLAVADHMEQRLPEFYQQLPDNAARSAFQDDLLNLLYDTQPEKLHAFSAALRNMGTELYFRQLLLCCTADVAEFCRLLQELPDEPLPEKLGGCLLYQICKLQQPFSEVGNRLDMTLLDNYIISCLQHWLDFAQRLLNYSRELPAQVTTVQECFVLRYVYSCLLFHAETEATLLIPLWETMLMYAEQYIAAVYRETLWQEEYLYLFSPLERFVYYSQQAQKARLAGAYATELSLLRQGLVCYPAAKKLVAQLKQEAEQQLMSEPEVQEEMAMLGEQVKQQIRGFIAQQRWEDAATVIKQLATIMPEDPEIALLQTQLQTTGTLLN